jgi:hypothetical protein
LELRGKSFGSISPEREKTVRYYGLISHEDKRLMNPLSGDSGKTSEINGRDISRGRPLGLPPLERLSWNCPGGT